MSSVSTLLVTVVVLCLVTSGMAFMVNPNKASGSKRSLGNKIDVLPSTMDATLHGMPSAAHLASNLLSAGVDVDASVLARAPLFLVYYEAFPVLHHFVDQYINSDASNLHNTLAGALLTGVVSLFDCPKKRDQAMELLLNGAKSFVGKQIAEEIEYTLAKNPMNELFVDAMNVAGLGHDPSELVRASARFLNKVLDNHASRVVVSGDDGTLFTQLNLALSFLTLCGHVTSTSQSWQDSQLGCSILASALILAPHLLKNMDLPPVLQSKGFQFLGLQGLAAVKLVQLRDVVSKAAGLDLTEDLEEIEELLGLDD
mmetsp:Transcript_40168/g.66000  ORF Transcript_40168/g.66000 Transcript_40168/m.66000 type:complete len:313 (-) Transcript_40168:167-1105(-)